VVIKLSTLCHLGPKTRKPEREACHIKFREQYRDLKSMAYKIQKIMKRVCHICSESSKLVLKLGMSCHESYDSENQKN
jgi:hypothetical protein